MLLRLFDDKTEIKSSVKSNCYKINTKNNSIICDSTMQLYISTKGNHPKFRYIKDLKRKDATYQVRLVKSKYKIINIQNYTLGYLRGLIDSDGTYEYRKDGRGKIQFIQKDKDLVIQFKCLYNDFIKPTNCRVFLDNGIYKFNGYRLIFETLTEFQYNDSDYLLGYLAGFFIGDGCLTYNIGTKHLEWIIAQSINKKSQYCTLINYILNYFNIRHSTYDSTINNFNMKEDCIMRQYKGSGVDILLWPFIYSCNKLEKAFDLIDEHLTYKSSLFYYANILNIEKLDRAEVLYKDSSESYILNNFIVKN